MSSSGLVFICDWFEAAFCAWARDTARGEDVAFHTARTDSIQPELTNELLQHLLRAWYRLSVYQQQLSRAQLPHRPHLFLMLKALVSHPSADVSDLAAGLLVLYQPDMSAEVQALVQAAPSAASSTSNPATTTPGAPTTVTALIRAEFELARAAEEVHRQLTQGEEKANVQLADADTNGFGPGVASPSPTPAAAVAEMKRGDDGDRAASPQPSSSAPSASPVPPLSVSASSPAIIPPSPPSPTPATFTAAFASLACPVCGECFSTDLHSYHHVANDHHLCLCTLCALAFPTEELLYGHFETHNHAAESADAPHACGLCGVSFHSEDALTLHHSVHLIERKAKQQYSKRKAHKRKHPTEDRSTSPSKRAKKGGDDEDEEGGGDDDEGEAGGSGPNRFPPAICSHPSHPTPLCFSSDEDLHAHSMVAHVTWLCFANDCEERFGSAQQLAEHILRVHVVASREYTTGAPAPPHCHYCGVVWTKKTPRTEHLHRHEKPFHCPKCGMRFARRTRWRNHVKRKHPDDFKRHSAIFEGAKG